MSSRSLESGHKVEQGLGPVGQRILRTLHEIGEPTSYRSLAEEVETDEQEVQKEVARLMKDGLVEEVGHIHTHTPQSPSLGLTEKGYRVSYGLTKEAP